MPEPTPPPEEPRLENILVAVDGSSYGMAALEAAVALAEVFDAELSVLYVEDVDLLNLSRVSWIREMDLLSGRIRRLEVAYVERSVRMEAARVRRNLQQRVPQTRVRWTFQAVRGRVLPELLKAAEAADLVSMGVRRHSMGPGPGSTARAVMDRAGTSVMMLWTGVRLGNRVCLLYDGSRQARRGLALARRLTRARDSEIFLMVDDSSGREPGAAAGSISEVPFSSQEEEDRERQDPHIAVLPLPDRREVTRQLRSLGCGLLMVPRGALNRSDGVMEGIRKGLDCPLLILD